MPLRICQLGEKILRKKAKDVASQDLPKLKNLSEEMLETMRLAEGIGLAAPQIGEQISLFVIDFPKEMPANEMVEWNGQHLPVSTLFPLIVVNPKIKLEGEKISFFEGCLSIQGIYEEILRPEKISAQWIDLKGKSHFLKAEGKLARVFQHEYDHLQGKLFIDYLSKRRRKEIENFSTP